MNKRVAVIDLGTNTFHLLIAEKSNDNVSFIHRERIFVKLAESDITLISDDAFRRGIRALNHFKKQCRKWSTDKVIAIGTAALRTAENAREFITETKKETGISVEIIPGLKEAFYIYNGVNHFTSLKGKYVIMDIGGGSVEFILGINDQIQQFESFPIGIAVLRNLKRFKDPISEEDILIVENHISTQLGEFQNILHQFSDATLVGASGTFEVIQNFLGSSTNLNQEVYNTDICDPILDKIIHSSLEQRIANPMIPDERVDMIVFASILIKFVLKLAKTNKLLISDFALKEGILYEYLD